MAAALDLDITIITISFDGQSDQYIWSSAHLDDLSTAHAVTDRAFALKALFDGALLVEHGSKFYPFKLEDLFDLKSLLIQPPSTGNVLAPPFSSKYLKTKVNAYLNPMHNFIGRVIFQSRYDVVSRNILSFLGVNGISWISLYAALDFLKHNGWNHDEIDRRNHASKVDLQRFCRTANNASAIGPFARHGEIGWKPPKNPMRLEEATDLLLPTVKAFLNDRALIIGLERKWAELIL